MPQDIPTRSIVQLPVATTVRDNDFTVVSQSGITKTATIGLIRNAPSSVASDLYIGRDAYVNRNLFVGNNVAVSGKVSIAGNTYIDGSLFLSGAYTPATIATTGTVSVGTDLYVNRDAFVSGKSFLGPIRTAQVSATGGNFTSNIKVDGTGFIGSTLSVAGFAGFSNDVSVSGGLTVGGTFNPSSVRVTNGASIGSDLYVNRDVFVSGTTNLNIIKTLGAVSVGTNIFVNGHVYVSGKGNFGSLNTIGVSTSDLVASNNVKIDGTVVVGSTLSVASDVYTNRDIRVSGRGYLGNATVVGSVSASTFNATGATKFDGNSSFGGSVSVANNIYVNGDFFVSGALALSSLRTTGQVSVGTDLYVNRDSFVSGKGNFGSINTISVSTGDIVAYGNGKVDGSLLVGTNLRVVTGVSVGTDLYVNRDSFVSGTGTFSKVVTTTLSVGQDAFINRDIYVSGKGSLSNLVVSGIVSANTVNATGSSKLDGAVALGSTLRVAGTVSATGNVYIDGNLNVAGSQVFNSLGVVNGVSVGTDLYVNRDSFVSGKGTYGSLRTVQVSASNLNVLLTSKFDGQALFGAGISVQADIYGNRDVFVSGKGNFGSLNTVGVSTGDLVASGNAKIDGSLLVQGSANFTANVSIASTKVKTIASVGTDFYVNRDVFVSGAIRSNNGSVLNFSSVTALKAYTPRTYQNGSLVYLQGYTTLNDGGEGLFQLTNVNPGTPDDGIIILLTVGGWWAVRQGVGSFVVPNWYGAGVSGTSSLNVIQNLVTNSGKNIKLLGQPSRYYLPGPVSCPRDTLVFSDAKYAIVDGATSAVACFTVRSSAQFSNLFFNFPSQAGYGIQQDGSTVSPGNVATSCVTVENCKFNRGSIGVWAFGFGSKNERWNISNNVFSSVGGGAAVLLDYVTNSKVVNNVFHKCNYNIQLKGGNQNAFTENEITNGVVGILFQTDWTNNGAYAGISDNLVANNSISYVSEEAISLDTNNPTGIGIRERAVVSAKSDFGSGYQLKMQGAWLSGSAYDGVQAAFYSGNNAGSLINITTQSGKTFNFDKTLMSSQAYANVSAGDQVAIGWTSNNNIISNNTIKLQAGTSADIFPTGIFIYYGAWNNVVEGNNVSFDSLASDYGYPSAIRVTSLNGYTNVSARASTSQVGSGVPGPSFNNIVTGNTVRNGSIRAYYFDFSGAGFANAYLSYNNRIQDNMVINGKVSSSWQSVSAVDNTVVF